MDVGMMWLWDLSSCLGWQKGGPTALWMQGTEVIIIIHAQLQLAAVTQFTHKCIFTAIQAVFLVKHFCTVTMVYIVYLYP